VTQPLDFQLVRDEYPDRWARADPRLAFIEPRAWDAWLVTLPSQGEEPLGDPWLVRLRRDHGAYVGTCEGPPDADRDGWPDDGTCPGHAAHDGPCAHLCAVRKAAAIGHPDARGTAVRIHSTEEVVTERGDHAIERGRTAADGGRRLGGERR
jgi:hypothetical protein